MMKTLNLPVLLTLVAILSAGCASDPAARTETRDTPAGQTVKKAPPSTAGPEVIAVTFGRGIARGDGLDVTFMHNVTRYDNGTADGVFKHSALGESGSIDIEGKVSCATLDSDSGRAWIGGQVTRNDSTNPRYAGPAGADVWFRVLDRNLAKKEPMISLPVFREKDIATAAVYCQTTPWSDTGLLTVADGALAIFP